jgi:hypothetical protein
MNAVWTWLCCCLLVLSQADPPRSSEGTTPRKPHPLAPSLPETTDEEEKRYDQIIDRFILADTGRLTGPEAQQAIRDFDRLPPQAIFALIRGLNKAAAIDHSCPALQISKKIARQLRTSDDLELLKFARENIGAGVVRSRHADHIKDLRVAISRRMTQVVNAPPTVIRQKP